MLEASEQSPIWQPIRARIETENLNSRDKGDSVALILHGVKWTLIIMSLSIERTANDNFDDEWELDAI